MSKETDSIPKQVLSKSNRKPSIKQKKAFDKIVENGGNVSKAMLEVGYSPATAKTPQKLTESLGFKSLADAIPDNLLVEKHTALLNKRDIETGDIDAQAVSKGLDMAYKLKGSYAAEKSLNLNVTMEATPEELLQLQHIASSSLSKLDD